MQVLQNACMYMYTHVYMYAYGHTMNLVINFESHTMAVGIPLWYMNEGITSHWQHDCACAHIYVPQLLTCVCV